MVTVPFTKEAFKREGREDKEKTEDVYHVSATVILREHNYNEPLTENLLHSFAFPQFTSFHSVFHSFHGLMNSINWPASSIWVFIAQLVEHCSAIAEAMGSNPVEAPNFSGYFTTAY